MSIFIFFRSILTVSLLTGAVPVFCQVMPHQGQQEVAGRGSTANSLQAAPDDEYVITWDTLSHVDAQYTKRIWRDIDLNASANDLLRTPATESPLLQILIDGIQNGTLKPYAAREDRFAGELKTDSIRKFMKPDVSATITKLRIKEDWSMLSNGKMLVRIVGIGPVVVPETENGIGREQPAFWLYYPALRKYLAMQKVSGVKNADVHNLDDVFQGRYFESTIIKVHNISQQ